MLSSYTITMHSAEMGLPFDRLWLPVCNMWAAFRGLEKDDIVSESVTKTGHGCDMWTAAWGLEVDDIGTEG